MKVIGIVAVILIVLGMFVSACTDGNMFHSTCGYSGCDKSVYKLGFCRTHYEYASLTGDYY